MLRVHHTVWDLKNPQPVFSFRSVSGRIQIGKKKRGSNTWGGGVFFGECAGKKEVSGNNAVAVEAGREKGEAEKDVQGREEDRSSDHEREAGLALYVPGKEVCAWSCGEVRREAHRLRRGSGRRIGSGTGSTRSQHRASCASREDFG